MKKRFFGLFLAIVMLISSIGTSKVFAMDLEDSLVREDAFSKTVTSTQSATASGYVFESTLNYGNATYIALMEPFRNMENLCYVKLNDDDRTHRLILKASFKKLTSATQNESGNLVAADNGLGEVKLGLYVSINGGTPKKYYHNYDGEPWQFEITGVPKGAVITITADAFTADGYTSNGNYRSIFINYLQAYFD